MERMTLREAAERTSRSITTLRRYIRSGRLHAEKRYGRFGPEYFVSDQDLAEAGLACETEEAALTARAPRTPLGRELVREAVAPHAGDRVPMSLYQELQMKHEQLLVQYGMMRAGGIRALELQGELEAAEQRLGEQRELSDRTRHLARRDNSRLQQELRNAHLELEGRALEISALQEKVRALEMMTRNAVTNETIEKQFSDVMDQANRVGRMTAEREWRTEESGSLRSMPRRGRPQDH